MQGDIKEAGLLDPYLEPGTVVFHMAAHASVAGSVREPKFDFDTNLAAFIEVLESVRRCGASLVFPSSAAVFDSRQALPHTETARKQPVSPYGAAKLAAEAYCQAYHSAYLVDVKVARLFNVYGPGMTRFAIFDFYRKLASRPKQMEILGDGAQIRDYLYIDDVVGGLIRVAEMGVPGEDYNLASGEPTNTLELARHVARIMGVPEIEIVVKGQSFPGDVPRWYADIAKIQRLEFRPTIDLDQGLRKTIAWFQEQAAEHSQ
jgi:UDP-glucose 4-epimerase